jgi:hypothetical protein
MSREIAGNRGSGTYRASGAAAEQEAKIELRRVSLAELVSAGDPGMNLTDNAEDRLSRTDHGTAARVIHGFSRSASNATSGTRSSRNSASTAP